MTKIIITGPESSGKSTLCQKLSSHFRIPSTQEYARIFLLKLGREYKKGDLLKIAKKQLKSEQYAQLLDTDLITIKIWSEHKYGDCNEWILKHIEKQRSEKRFYLLCKPDIKWTKDVLRENPTNRMSLFKRYQETLDALKHPYFIIDGKEREKKSINKLTSLKSICTFTKS